MNRQQTWAFLVAAALVASPALAADEAQKSPAAAFPAGVKTRDAEDPADIHRTFGSIAEAAVTKDGFDDVVERLVDQDRNRIGKAAEEKSSELDKAVEQVRRAWKDKYGEELDVDPKAAFESVTLLRGEIEDPKQAAANWPVRAVAQPSAGGDAETAGAAQRADQENAKGNADPNLNSNIEKGRDVAIATVPASHGLPALHVSLIREAQGWRIDVPNNLAAGQIRDNLVKHLGHVAAQVGQWPADKNDAPLLLAHHVLMAVYNVDVPQREDSARDK